MLSAPRRTLLSLHSRRLLLRPAIMSLHSSSSSASSPPPPLPPTTSVSQPRSPPSPPAPARFYSSYSSSSSSSSSSRLASQSCVPCNSASSVSPLAEHEWQELLRRLRHDSAEVLPRPSSSTAGLDAGVGAAATDKKKKSSRAPRTTDEEWHVAPFPDFAKPTTTSSPPTTTPTTTGAPVLALQRTYRFRNFVAALSFASRVGDEVAEVEAHHPALVVEWGRCTVAWWTHVVGGLHENDFVCAAKTDAVARDAEGLRR